MKNKRFFCLLAMSISLLLSGIPLPAQETYSLEKVIDLYKQNNIVLKLHQLRIDHAVSGKKIAGAWENPSIRYTQEGINLGTQEDPVKGREFQLALEQRIPLSGRIGLQTEHAEQSIQIATAEYQRIYWDGLSHIKALFFEIQSLTVTLEILEKTKLKIEELNATIIENYERGEASGIDTARIAVILKDIDLEKYLVETSLDSKKRELLTFLSLSSEPSQIALEGGYSHYVIMEEKKDLARALIENNPHIQILVSSQQQEEILLALEKRKNIPDLMASGGYKREHFYDTYAFSLSLDIPILYQRRGEIEVAQNSLRMNALQQKLAAKELLEAFEKEYAKHLKLTELIHLFQSQYLSQADRLEDATVAAYKGGEVNMLVLVDAIQSALKTRRDFIALVLQNNVAVFDIEKMAGRKVHMEKLP